MARPVQSSATRLAKTLRSALWAWPDGLAWRITEGVTIASRRRKYGAFLTLCHPTADDTVLDVGISGFSGRATNYLELWYPWPGRVTALAHGSSAEFDGFRQLHPQVRVVLGDGRALPFDDGAFDIVFSNAVLEHVGSAEQQAYFVRECLRVGTRVFLTTPDPAFPVDSHTLLPLVHWLPRRIRHRVYDELGRSYFASEDTLNLVSHRRLSRLVPSDCSSRIIRQRTFGIPSALMLVASRAAAGRSAWEPGWRKR